MAEQKTRLVTNRQMARAAADKVTFRNGKNTARGYQWHGLYVVESYGSHFPMYVYDPEVGGWFGNTDKYSRTTTRHQSDAQPVRASEITWVDTSVLRSIIEEGGYASYVSRRIEGRTP